MGPPSRVSGNKGGIGAEINTSTEVEKITNTVAQEGVKLNSSVIITVMLIKISPVPWRN